MNHEVACTFAFHMRLCTSAYRQRGRVGVKSESRQWIKSLFHYTIAFSDTEGSVILPGLRMLWPRTELLVADLPVRSNTREKQ